MARAVQPNEEEEADMAEVAADAVARAEANARRKKKGRGMVTDEPEESDFAEGAELGGVHRPKGVATFWLEANGSRFGCVEVDSGCAQRVQDATVRDGKKQGKLLREQARLQVQADALSARFVEAVRREDGEEGETADEVEALIEAHEDLVIANQRQQAELLLSPQRAMREIVVLHCLRDWKHKDGVPFNAANVASLSPTRAGEIGELCWMRYLQGGAARFR